MISNGLTNKNAKKLHVFIKSNLIFNKPKTLISMSNNLKKVISGSMDIIWEDIGISDLNTAYTVQDPGLIKVKIKL